MKTHFFHVNSFDLFQLVWLFIEQSYKRWNCTLITQSLLVRSNVHQLLCTIFPQKHPHGTSNCIHKKLVHYWQISCIFAAVFHSSHCSSVSCTESPLGSLSTYLIVTILYPSSLILDHSITLNQATEIPCQHIPRSTHCQRDTNSQLWSSQQVCSTRVWVTAQRSVCS